MSAPSFPSSLPPPFLPATLIGRLQELEQLMQILIARDNCFLTGVPGSGRRFLIRTAAHKMNARLLEIDCLRATSAKQLLRLYADRIMATFKDKKALALIQEWSLKHPVTLEMIDPEQAQIVWHLAPGQEGKLFQAMLGLPQVLSQGDDRPTVVVFHNFLHLRSWDRGGQWTSYLEKVLKQPNQVSFILVTTVVETGLDDQTPKLLELSPMSATELQPWVVNEMAGLGLQFDPQTQALELFLSYVQGHLGDAIALLRRVWLESQAMSEPEPSILQAHHIHRSMVALIEDISVTFESLLLLLPSSQIKVLESLALDPTDSPHAHSYIQKHQLSRGGSLQGALNSLEQKGLIYGPQHGYRVALPFLDFWLKQRLTGFPDA